MGDEDEAKSEGLKARVAEESRLGYSGAPVRLGVPPEISLIVLRTASTAFQPAGRIRSAIRIVE